MNNIIVKTTLLTAEEFQNQYESLEKYALRLLVLLIIASIILYGTNYIYKKYKNPLTMFINKLQTVQTTIALAVFSSYSVQVLAYPLNHEVGKTKANLSEIKEHIKISEGKLTVQNRLDLSNKN